MITERDRGFLQKTLALAETSLEHGTYPIGALLVRFDGESWEGRNRVYERGDITHHAEMDLFRNPDVGLRIIKDDFTFTLYCTMEPCSMCMSAIKRARGIRRVVCLMRDPTSWGGLRTRPFYSALTAFKHKLRRLGINVGGADQIRLRRVSAAGFVVEFPPAAEDELVIKAQELWAQWLAVADTAKGKW